MAKKLLLFDLDGTLLLTGGAGSRSFERAYEVQFRVRLDTGTFRMDGMTDPAIARHFLTAYGLPHDDEAVNRILDSYLSGLEEEVKASPAYHVLPHVTDALQELSRRPDLVLGLATGNIEQGARIKLARADLNKYFPFGGYGSDSEDRPRIIRTAIERGRTYAGWAFAPEEIAVIGDTPRDIAAGKANQARTLAVATGNYDVESLRAHGADHAVSTLHHPDDWLSALFPR